jgi:RimJ/RimL family protein N-acetyltransferase
MAYLDDELIPLPDGYQPIHLETDRLTLDSVSEDDAEALLHATVGDGEVMRYIGSGVSTDVDHARRRLFNVMNVERRIGYSILTVRIKATGEVIGTCGLIPIERTGPEIEIGYIVAKKHWQKGYTSEAAAECLRWGFEDLGLETIIAVCEEPNTGSWKVMEKIGMKRVGMTDKYYEIELLMYDLTAQQWRDQI